MYRQKTTATFFLLIGILTFGITASFGATVTAPGRQPLEIEETQSVGGELLYDTITWLGHFFSSVEYLADEGRVQVKVGDGWAAISQKPPFAMKDGRVVEVTAPPVAFGENLLVTAAFIEDTGSKLFDIPFTVDEGDSEVTPLRLIAIDASHGGDDTGSMGMTSLLEKDLLLTFATHLGRKLTEAGYGVLLTRSEDINLSARQRAAIVNNREADLLISLEAVGAEKSDARGFEIFIPPTLPDYKNVNLWLSGQSKSSDESRRFGPLLREHLKETVETFDRGLIEVGTPLLNAVTCPAVILSVGNISWPQEVEYLTKPEEMDNLSGSIISAINEFFGGAMKAEEL